MALKLRPTGLGSGIDKDRPDYTVYCGEWDVGRIYQTRGGPDSLRWFWSLTVNGPMTRSDRVATLEEAKAQFQKSWDAWKAWAKLEEMRRVAHRQGHQIFRRLTRVEPYRWPTTPRSGGAFLCGPTNGKQNPPISSATRQLRRSRPKAASARLFVRNTRSGR